MDRRTLLRAGLATSGGLALALATGLESPAVAAPRIGRTLAKGLAAPWGISFLPNGNALVGERDSGDVHLVSRGGGRSRIGTLDVFSQVSQGGEGGLLGLALHPDFPRTSWLYAYLSTSEDNRIVRMPYVDGGLGRPRTVLADIPMSVHHNGGGLVFGPDGLLYASTGDGEDGSRAQSRKSLGGKVLRLTPEGEVPTGNPFDNYTWSMGHRNVEGITFDSRGNLWASEFGEKDADELNRIVAGKNYGWPRVEGSDGGGGFRDPFAQWSPTSTCSPAGIAVANDRAWVGALRGQCVFSVRLRGSGAGRIRTHFTGRFGRVRQVAAAPDGTLWITSSNRDGRGNPGLGDDKVVRVVLP